MQIICSFFYITNVVLHGRGGGGGGGGAFTS